MGRAGRKFRNTYALLRDWYGKTRADVEITAHCPEPVKVGDLAEKIFKKTFSKETVLSMELQHCWKIIAGPQIAAVAKPLRIQNKIAEVEVLHNAWLRELDGPVKAQLIKKVNATLGQGTCKDIRFVPGGH